MELTMKAFIATVLLVVPIIAQAQTTTRNEAAEKEVAQLERELHQARVRNDVAAVNGLLAPDFYTINSGGDRSEAGSERKGPYNTTPNGDRWEKVELTNQRVRVYGDTAVSTFLRTIDVRNQDGSARKVQLVGTHVWVRSEGRWRAVLSQVTPVLE
jgi:ketosteroid isomerase-like protein